MLPADFLLKFKFYYKTTQLFKKISILNAQRLI